MKLPQMTILAGLAVALVACARQQTEEDMGDVQPAAADTAMITDTAATPAAPPPAADTGLTQTPPPVTGDTAVTIDTASTTGEMSDTAMTQMGDTTTTSTAGGDVVASSVTWRATLLPQVGAQEGGPEQPGTISIGGAAFVIAADTGTTARVQIRGAMPGAILPWHVHKGTCGNDQGILGPADAYVPITVGQDGQAEVSVTLPVPTPTSGQYMINIHKSSQEMKTIVACGPLTLASSQ